MLQIIGWMGCLYLLVKALELFSDGKARRNDDGSNDVAAMIGGFVAILGAIGFFVMLNAQADTAAIPFADAMPSESGYPDYGSDAEVEEMALEVEDAADAVAAAAEAAMVEE